MIYSSDKPFTLDRVVRLLISLAIVGLGIYLIYILSSVLLPFLVAWLIAYLLNPIVEFLQQKLRLKKRPLAVIITFILVFAVLISVFILVAPFVENELFQINSLISTYQIESLNINGLPVSVHDFIVENVDFNSLKNALVNGTSSETIKIIIPALQGVVSNSISFILGFTVIFIIILYLIFILLDYDKINKLWIDLIPPKYRTVITKITLDVEKNMNTYFRHQALICLIVAILYAIAFQIIGLPLAIIIGVLIGVLHMVPYLHAISIIPVSLLCWLKVSQTGDSFWPLMGSILMIYVIVQCIIDMLLVPRIMGKAMGLNPAIILLSLSIWGSLLGIVGMIIAIPMTTLLLSYYQSMINTVPETSLIDEVKESDTVMKDE